MCECACYVEVPAEEAVGTPNIGSAERGVNRFFLSTSQIIYKYPVAEFVHLSPFTGLGFSTCITRNIFSDMELGS